MEFVSKLPEPRKTNYQNCFFTSIFAVKGIKKGEKISERLEIVFPGFEKKILSPESEFKAGDKLRIEIVPFESLDLKKKQTQQADEIAELDLDVYFAVKSEIVQDFSVELQAPSPPQEKKNSRDLETTPRTADGSAEVLRRADIEKDKKYIDDLLVAHGGSWDKWVQELETFRQEYQKANSSKSEKWVADSFFSAGTAYINKTGLNFVRDMINFKNYLKQFNIDLIIVRVPFKGEICADLFAQLPPDKVSDPRTLEMIRELLENDVETVYVNPLAVQERTNYPLMFWYQKFSESHPAEGMARTVAKAVAERLKRYNGLTMPEKGSFSLKDESQSPQDFKWPNGNPKFPPNESVRFKAVCDPQGNILQIGYNENRSPILLAGNSFLVYPAIKKGASIPHYLAYESGFVPDILYRDGAHGIGRFVYKMGEQFLAGRKVLVYVADPTAFLEQVPELPLTATLKNKKLNPIHTAIYNKTNWKTLIFSTPPEQKTEFIEDEAGNISLIPKNNLESGKSGTIAAILPDKEEFSKAKFLAVTLSYPKTNECYGTIEVTYAGQKQIVRRSPNCVKGDVFYFNFDKNARDLILSFPHTNKSASIQISNIEISILDDSFSAK